MDHYSTHAEAEYKKAFAAFDAATREAEELTNSLRDEVPALRGHGWQKVVVANVGAEFPIELTLFHMASATLDGASVPWGRRLGEVLARWHEAKIHLANAWEIVRHRPPPGMSRPPFPT